MGNKYSFNDFAIRQVANLLGHSADVETYTDRSFVRALCCCSVVTRCGFVWISRAYLRGDSEDVAGYESTHTALKFNSLEYAVPLICYAFGQRESLRSLASQWYRNVWDPSVRSDGFQGKFTLSDLTYRAQRF